MKERGIIAFLTTGPKYLRPFLRVRNSFLCHHSRLAFSPDQTLMEF
jgi:hypothetical protein